MAHWVLGNAADGIHLDVNENSSNGAVSGTLTVDGLNFSVSGLWTADGSLPGRNVSNINLRGSAASPNAPGAPVFVALSGQISFNNGNPNITGMSVGVYTASSNTGALVSKLSQLSPA
ncbi:MAG: hypothetical protein AAFR21_02985 [Pseudomonadota bacterium]